MHNSKHLSKVSMGRKVLSAAIASTLLLLSNANATGLGKLTVLSALGQPLKAEIELTAPNKEEIGALLPKIASPDAFKQANIDFNPALLSVRFNVEQRGGGYVIRLTSSQSINEPFVDMLVELNSTNGRLVREYTFLLDPPELRSSQPVQVANPVAVVTSPSVAPSNSTSARPAISPPLPEQVAPKSKEKKQASTTVASTPEAGDSYKVKAGDTLNKIASSYRQDGVSLDQLLVGLYNANPQAFVGKNMNRLRKGEILTIPDPSILASASKAEARSIVLAHANDFNAYRNKLAGQVVAAPAEQTTTSKQVASGKITAKVNELPTASNESADKLKLSKVAPASSAAATGKATAEEDKIAKAKAAADANARVKELEKNVGELNKLLEVKDKSLADKQAAAKESALTSKETAASVAASAASSPASAPEVASSPVVASAAEAPVAPKRKPLPPPPPPPEPSFVDSILESDYLIPGAGVLLLALGGYGIISNRRKKKLAQFEDSMLTGSSIKANSMFGSTGGQSIDTNNSVFNSNFAPSASQLDANEVDPVAEADVYIAYGRDTQAEEILKEALRTQPDRHAVRVKLLEIYYSRKDVKSFERLASELYGMTGGEGEDWAQAASMGIVLDPANPLYAGGKANSSFSAVGAMGAAAALSQSTEPLEDLDPEALLGNSLSKDMLDAISIIDTAANADEQLSEPEIDMNDGSLDFDLGLDDEVAEEQVPEIATAVAAEAEPVQLKDESLSVVEPLPEVDFGTIDFASESKVEEPEVDLALDFGDVPAVPEEPAANNPHEIEFTPQSLDVPLSLNDDLPKVDDPVEPQVESQPEVVATAPEAFEFDLSGIDFNLDDNASAKEEPSLSLPSLEDAQNSNFVTEMATKLDLAVAYHEIGDKEGARELLDEVVKGGAPDQVEKAKGLLSRLV
jgi:pilus assembly protein FimV